MDPLLVNLSEFDMRLLYVSRDRTKRFDNVPSDLPQTHFVTDQRMSQLVYPFVEICYNRQVFRLGLGMMWTSAHGHLSMKVKGCLGLCEVSRFHPIEGEDIV
jgi:hypothetical protein